MAAVIRPRQIFRITVQERITEEESVGGEEKNNDDAALLDRTHWKNGNEEKEGREGMLPPPHYSTVFFLPSFSPEFVKKGGRGSYEDHCLMVKGQRARIRGFVKKF